MKRAFSFVLILLAPTLFGCKDKAIGVAYVVGDRVPIFAKPDRFLQPLGALPRDTKIEILEARVPDPRAPKRAFWYRARTEKFAGFISYDEELVRQNLASFQDLEKPQSALVTATALRLRQDPSLQAKTLTAMGRLSVVDILQEGSLRQKIGKNEDTWVRVRTADGKEGFSFAAHLHRGNPEEIRRLARARFEKVNGYIFATSASPGYLNEPGGRAIKQDDPVTGGYHDMNRYPRGEGEAPRYARVSARMKHDGVQWYHVEQTDCDMMECYALNAWVSSKEVEFVTDFFGHTLKRAGGKTNLKLLREIQASLEEGEDLHAGLTSYKTIDLTVAARAPNTGEPVDGEMAENTAAAADGIGGDAAVESEKEPGPAGTALPIASTSVSAPQIKHYLVKAAIGPRGQERTMIVAGTAPGRYRTLGVFPVQRMRDLDGDGQIELITDESERADITFSVYTYAGPAKGFRKVLHLSTTEADIRFADPYILLESDPKYFQPEGAPFQKRFAKSNERALILENGSYKEIPIADVSAEARSNARGLYDAPEEAGTGI